MLTNINLIMHFQPRISYKDHKGSNTEDCLLVYCRKYWDNKCSKYPNIFTLVGHFGVSLMIFESGMHFHFGMLPTVGPKVSLSKNNFWTCLIIWFRRLYYNIISPQILASMHLHQLLINHGVVGGCCSVKNLISPHYVPAESFFT